MSLIASAKINDAGFPQILNVLFHITVMMLLYLHLRLNEKISGPVAKMRNSDHSFSLIPTSKQLPVLPRGPSASGESCGEGHTLWSQPKSKP